MKIIGFAILFLIPSLLFAKEDFCADQKGGWKTICLNNLNEKLSNKLGSTYMTLQNRIKATGQQHSPEYSQQFGDLLRKNTHAFTKYVDSYCNLQVFLYRDSTSLDNLLMCMARTTQLRIDELNLGIEIVDKISGEQK